MNSRITTEAAQRIAGEIAAAGGREVCFVATVDADGIVVAVRPVARGTAEEVLALPGVAQRGEMVLHNHPGGLLEPSAPDLSTHPHSPGYRLILNNVLFPAAKKKELKT